MSTVAISYRSLRDSSNEANAVARRLNQYGDSLYRDVYRKLNQYGGEWTENIYSAIQKTNDKINSLHERANRFQSYSHKLTSLQDECRNVDRAVRSKVSELTLDYKQSHGIKSSFVEDCCNWLLSKITSEMNKSWIGRAFNDVISGLAAERKKLKDAIKEWFNYGGGKQIIKGVVSSIFQIAIAVLTIFTPGASIFAFIGALILIANATANYVNELDAYTYASSGDPAMAKRRSDLNTLSDTIRTDSDDKNVHLFANGLDVVKFVCDSVLLLKGTYDLVKNGYKWATGSGAKLKDITLRDLFSKDTYRAFKSKFSDIKKALRFKEWTTSKDYTSVAWNAFKSNLKDAFWNFTGEKEITSSLKNLIGIPKDLIEGGFGLKNLGKIAFHNILVEGIGVFSVNDYNSEKPIVVPLDDFTSLIVKGVNMLGKDSLMNKLSSRTGVNVSLPKVEIPQIMIHSYA